MPCVLFVLLPISGDAPTGSAELQGCGQSEREEVRKTAAHVWRAIAARIDEASFEGCKGRAAQGNWIGRCEFLPDGNRAVRGDHKIANQWGFEDYSNLRGEIARGIIRLSAALR